MCEQTNTLKTLIYAGADVNIRVDQNLDDFIGRFAKKWTPLLCAARSFKVRGYNDPFATRGR